MRRLRAWIGRRTRSLGIIGLGAAVALLVWIRCGALPAGLLDDDVQPSTLIVDRNGEVLYEARSSTGLRSSEFDVAHLPAVLLHATMAAEDTRFLWHIGIDPIAIARATIRNIRARDIVEGGSTITQQVAKLLLARQSAKPAHGWFAKLREATIALRLEHRLTKNELAAIYLSLAPYGNQIQGAERAAHAYFGRSAGSLTAAEAAYVAALPQQPSRFNPWRTPDRALPRQARVLDTMAAEGWLTSQDLAAARSEYVRLTRDSSAPIAPHFVERVIADVGRNRPRRIQTTLDATLQRQVAGIITAQREALVEHHASDVAVAVLNNHTGEWLAWEGSGRYNAADTGGKDAGGKIDGVITPRQPGSALKPFTYAAAFERGIEPAHVLADVPSQFPTAEAGILYSPRNYDGQFRGPLLARAALAGSENVPAVALAQEIGVPTVARLLRRAGFSTLDNNAAHYGLGLTLGNAEVRLDELMAAYAMLARGGQRVVTRRILASSRGPRDDASGIERVVSERTAFWITDILADADARSYIFGHGGSLEFPFAVAAKTGTSQSYFDNWVVGYTRDVTVGVWVGNFDRTPLRGSSGITGAGPIFHAVMLAAVERVNESIPLDDTTPIVAPPAGLERVEVCATSGMRAGDACPTRVSEWLTTPDGPACTWHHATDEGLVTLWPDVFRDWARDAGFLRSAPESLDIPVRINAAHAAATPTGPMHASRLTIVRPLAGAVFMVDPTLRPDFQALTLRASGGAPGALAWFVDNQQIATSHRDNPVRWSLVPGQHRVVVRDMDGASAETHIEVR